ncbi:MAG: Transcriptional regulator, AcrR family, partial [uncultured Solirubrobacteraceae bacterium]
GPTSPTGDPPGAPRRVHRLRARARAPQPARAPRHRCGRLDADADLPLRHARRPAPRDPRTGATAPGRGVHRPPARPARRALSGDAGAGLVRDDRAAGPPLPAHVQPAARHRRRAALARVPARRDHGLARAPGGRHAQPRPTRAGHRRPRRHPRPADGPRRDRRRRTHPPGLPRLPRHDPQHL